MQRSIYLIHGIFHSFLNPQIHQGVTECPPHVEFHRQIINPLKSFNRKEQIKIYLNYAIHKIITINVKKNCKQTVQGPTKCSKNLLFGFLNIALLLHNDCWSVCSLNWCLLFQGVVSLGQTFTLGSSLYHVCWVRSHLDIKWSLTVVARDFRYSSVPALCL